MNLAEWNQGLLLAVVLVILGAMLLVSASSWRERWIAVGVVSQGILVAFVTNGVFHNRSDLMLAAIVLASLFGMWSVLVAQGGRGIQAAGEAGSAIDSPSSSDMIPAISKPTLHDHSHPVEEE